MPIKVVELELSKPIKGLKRLDHQYSHIWGLVRSHGDPLGWIKIKNEHLPLSAWQIGEIIADAHRWAIFEHGMRISMKSEQGLTPSEHLVVQCFHPITTPHQEYPLATVIVLLPYNSDLKFLPACLKALEKQDHPNYEILIACNGSIPSDLTNLAKEFNVRLISGAAIFYRAVREARGEFISFTGSQAIPDKGWLRGVAEASDNINVAAVTGLTLPLELETAGQVYFDSYAKRPFWFNRYYNYGQIYELPPENFGTPLNASFRRSFLLEHCQGEFFALDFGIKQLLSLYYRALKLNLMVGYEPCALIWERYPQNQVEAEKQLARENLERAEFLAREMRWNPRYRRILWQKLKKNPASKRAILRLGLKIVQSGLRGRNESSS